MSKFLPSNRQTLDEFQGVVPDDRTGYHGMPPYIQFDYETPYAVELQFKTDHDVEEFIKLTGDMFKNAAVKGKWAVKSYWYPPLARGERGSDANYIWVDDDETEISLPEETVNG